MSGPTQEIAYQSPLNALIQLLGQQNTQGSQNSSQQATQNLLSSLLTSLQGTNTSSTTNTADLDALRQTYQQASQGMTPEQLTSLISSIFTEGAAQVPSLIGAYANATGSRATGNSATRLALDELNKNLSTQAAQALLNYNTSAQQTAANTASQIAANTRQTDQVAANTQQQQQSTNQTTTGTTNTATTSNQTQRTQPNYSNIGLALGGSLLNNLLKGGNISKLLGMGGTEGGSALTMGAGGSPLSFGGTGSPGGITSLSSPSFASPLAAPATASLATPTGLNNNFIGLGAAPTQQQLVQQFSAPGGLTSSGLSGVGGASTLGGMGGVSGLGSPTNLGTFDGSGIMGAGNLLNFGGIGAGNADFLGSAMGGLGALGGGASTLAGAGGAFGTNLAGNGGITDAMSGLGGSGTLGFGDFLSQGGGSGVGSLFGGIGDALSGAADWIGSFFADGGQVGGARPGMPMRGYADGGSVAGNTYRPAGNDIFQETLNRRLMEAGIMPPPVTLQAGNTPRIAGTADLPTPQAGQIAGLIPFLIQQMIMPGRLMQAPQLAGGFADGGAVGSPGIFGMADGGQNYGNRVDGTPKGDGYYGAVPNPNGGISTELSAGINLGGQEVLIPLMVPGMSAAMLHQLLATPQGQMPAENIIRNAAEFAKQRQAAGLPFFARPEDRVELPAGFADGGTVRNRNNMGLAPVRQQTSAQNFTGYDNPALAQFVNAGGSAADYVDPAAQAAELAAREALAQDAMRIAQGQQFSSGQTAAQVAGTGAYEGADPRMAGINEALAAIQRGSNGNLSLQAQQLFQLANTTQDPEVANYYRYLGNNVTGQIQAQSMATQVGGRGSSGVGEGVATGATSVSQGQAGLSGGLAPGVSPVASAVGLATGVPAAAVVGLMGMIGQAVADANAPGGISDSGPGIGGGVGSVGSEGGIGSVGEGIGVGSGAAGIGGIGDAATSGVGVGVGADAGASSVGDGGGGGGGGGKIICTAMNDLYGLPYRENKIWIGYAAKHLTRAHERGYHKIFLPLVRYGFKSGEGPGQLLVRRALIWIAKNRTVVLQDRKTGKVTNRWHHMLCKVGEKICQLVGS